MISNRFNKPKDSMEEQKQMNNQPPANGTYARAGDPTKVYGEKSGEAGDAVVHRVYGSRERLVDGFPTKPEESFENQMKAMTLGQRANQRDTRVMPPLPVLRGTHHPNFSGASEVISPILPSTPISPHHQQRRLQQGNYDAESPYQLSHQQIQRKLQNQSMEFATARAHLVNMVDGGQQRQPVYEPARHFPNQEPIYATGSYLPPHQRRPPPPNSKPVYRPHPTEPEGQEGSLTANLESNGVYISKTPNPKFSESYAYSQNPIYGSRPPETPKQPPPAKPEPKKPESETDDDGGFKTAMRARPVEAKPQSEELEKENQESMEKAAEEKEQPQETKQERPGSRNEILSGKSDNYSSRSDLLRQDNKVSSATSSDYEKATKRSVGQGSSIGDSGRGSAAYSSGRQESGRGSVEYSSGREKPKERPDTSNESSDGVKRDGGYSSQKSLSRGNDSSEWVDIVESELRQILDPKMHGLGSFGSGRGSTLSESVSSLTPPLPPLSPGGGSSPTPTPRQMRYKHSSLPYNVKGDYDSKMAAEDRKFAAGKSQRNNTSGGRGNWGGRNGKNGEKMRSLGSTSRNSKVPLAMFGVETDLASTTTGPLDSVLDSRLSDHTSDEDLSTTIDATDALAIRRQLQGLENMYSEVLKLLGVKKYGGRYQPTDPRGKRRYGSMSSLPSSVSSRPMRDKRRDDRKKVKDIKGINKRFQRLESHVVTLARSVAHLSSEMRTQHLMIQEMENIRSEISSLRTQTSMNVRSQSVPRALNSMLVSPNGESTDPTALTNPARVKKLTKFFGDEPPLLRLFLKKLGYEKYAGLFETERIGMVELPYLTEERLQKMGIPMGPRLRILQEAQISFCRDSVYVV
ncbi:UNVERIFIED_CONTAM: hypothetical protein PYX00_001911 [Menopon gallinae]|uniref:SAM domain-containing protein n=1 Tax=Menopon gallinae TaxID=328185 RepID=A0AAW2IFV2_9NEOP